MVTLDRHGIPAKVLNGKEPNYLSVYNFYRAKLVQALMQIIQDEYWKKSEGGTDSLGVEWEPLKPRTLQHKEALNLYEYGSNQNKLPPLLRRKWDRILAEQTAIQMSGGVDRAKAKRIAKRIAWDAIDPMREYVEKINIRTGRLYAAFAPGTVVNNRYYPPNQDQVVSIDPSRLQIKINVEYLDAVQEGERFTPARPIIPDDISAWVAQAHDTIMPEVKQLYVSTYSSVKERERQAKAKRSSRSKRKGNRSTTRRKSTRLSGPIVSESLTYRSKKN